MLFHLSDTKPISYPHFVGFLFYNQCKTPAKQRKLSLNYFKLLSSLNHEEAADFQTKYFACFYNFEDVLGISQIYII